MKALITKNLNGQMLCLETEKPSDRKVLEAIRDAFLSENLRHGSLSVHNRLIRITIPVFPENS